jgi:poly-beta-1,6-N-acetyl-D-glucosamine synthase
VKIAIVIPFLNEGRYLDTLLESMAAQTRPPDRLLLVDDGSTDSSPEIAALFAERFAYARVLHRPPRAVGRDRLIDAAEWRAFRWGFERLDGKFDVVAKMDADLRLNPGLVEAMERAFEADPHLGMAGTYLSVEAPDGRYVEERSPAYHVRGPTKFYRRACYEQIDPVLSVPGWETIDEVKARMLGWRTLSFSLPGEPSVHLRPTGTLDGGLRASRRDGQGAYSYGAHPLHVLLGAANRVRDRPYLLAAVNYLTGWTLAAARRVPRAEPEVRAFARREQLSRMRALVEGDQRP